NMESETEKVLLGLGFLREEFEKPVQSFSGGWRMRVELAKLLLMQPDLLLMDEPTNHLDIESVQWLEQFLKNYAGALMLVSHDRIFLDTITNRTLEVAQRKIFDYTTNYSGYLEQKAMRQEQQTAAYDNQQREIAEMERFITRFKAKASKATQAQSRVKALERMDRIELESDATGSLNIRFPEPPRSGKVVAETKALVKNYGPKQVLKKMEFTIERGEKIAFVGKNGEGKSTLARILAGELSYEGDLAFGHNVKVAYYAQHQTETLPMDKTVLEAMEDVSPPAMRPRLRAILGAFLFSGNTVEKKVKVLSGGEKSRLAMARLLLEPSNLIILDEPTNHLDMASKNVLKEALVQYPGTLVIVSHDREFLHGLSTHVFAFSGGKLKVYPGDIYEYLERHKIASLDAISKPEPKEKEEVKTEAPKKSYEEQKQQQNRLKKVQRQIDDAESRISRLEKDIASLESDLAKPENSARQFDMLEKHKKLTASLSKEMSDWERYNAELEALNK
nr:ATP-binding cassette domain-containing protein [Bacteroidota bacterium]